MSSGIHLVYQFFKVKSSDTGTTTSQQEAARRQREYDECLYRNLIHPHVERVHILLENDDDQVWLQKTMHRLRTFLGDNKLKLTTRLLGGQMLYSDAFSYCNEELAGSIAVILNADIFIGRGVELLVGADEKRRLFKNTVFSLTRHEHKICTLQSVGKGQVTEGVACGCPFVPNSTKYFGSHDSFWFVPPIAPHFVKSVHHVQNRWGAEHLVIKELLAHGYKVLNPSKTIYTLHNHASALRPWRKEDGADIELAHPRDHLPLYPIRLSESYPWWPLDVEED